MNRRADGRVDADVAGIRGGADAFVTQEAQHGHPYRRDRTHRTGAWSWRGGQWRSGRRLQNWRLALIQLLPGVWIWLATWDLKRHLLHGSSFAHLNLAGRLALAAAVVAFTIAAYWCNTVFAFAVDGPPPPRLAPAARKARPRWPTIVTSGLVLGSAVAFAAVVVPRFAGIWLFSLILGIVIALMMISFVAVPARIIGVKSHRKQSPQEAIGAAAAAGTLSAVAMAPGYLLDRVGLILLGQQHLHILGFAMLSIGTALYAAGMSSVKAVKLSMKLTPTAPSHAPIVAA